MNAPSQNPAPEFRWGFASAAVAILGWILASAAVGRLMEGYPPAEWLMAHAKGLSEAPSPWAAWRARDFLFSGFCLTSLAFVWLQRQAWSRFLRSMHTGVGLVTISAFAVFLGALVPQIENFEDTKERVTPANYERNFAAFSWGTSYFLYHMMRPYGWGAPKPVVPEGAAEALERFGRAYGAEEQKNRTKLMQASFSGQAKSAEVEAFQRRHDSKLRRTFDACTSLEFNRLYKSDWFAGLLALLGASVAANLFRPGMASKWYKIEKLGFVLVHAGMLIMLAGGAWSKLRTDRGILQLFLGDPPSDTYWQHYDPNKLARMPFAVGLDHFARKEWKALEVHFLDQKFQSRPPRFTLWEGWTQELDYQEDESGKLAPSLRLEVKQLHDRAKVGLPQVEEAPADDGMLHPPLVELEVPAAPGQDHAGQTLDQGLTSTDGQTTRMYLSPMLESQAHYFDPQGRFRLGVAQSSAEGSLFPPDDQEQLGTLDLEILGSQQSAPLALPFAIGSTLALPGGWSVRVVDATSDLKLGGGSKEERLSGSRDDRPMSERPYRFAAAWVDVIPPPDYVGKAPDAKGLATEPERRLVVEMLDPVSNGLQPSYRFQEVIVRMRWDRWRAPGGPRYVLRWSEVPDSSSGAGGASRIAAELIGQDGSRKPVAAGQALPLEGLVGSSAPILARRFLMRAQFVANSIEFLPADPDPDGWNPHFYSREPRGLELEITEGLGTPKAKTSRVQLASTPNSAANVWYSTDQRLALQFLENSEGFPFDWRSVLSVWEKDERGEFAKVPLGSPKQREIRVNDYFKYRGWRFFQTNAEVDQPTYSGIGVVYDPGIPYVLAGMYVIIAGTVVAYLIRPILKGGRTRTERT